MNEDFHRRHSGPSAAMRSLRLIGTTGIYIDPVNEPRFAYLRGDIDVDEFEHRVGEILGLAGLLRAESETDRPQTAHGQAANGHVEPK